MLLGSASDNNAGYSYDHYRQLGKTRREEKEKYVKLKKKIDRLSKKNKHLKPKN